MKTPVSTTPSSPSPPADGARVPVPRKYWGWAGALLAFVAAFGATIFAAIPALAIGDATNSAKATGSVISSVLTCVCFVGMPLLILSMLVGGLRRRDVGLVLPPRRIWRIPVYAAIALVLYLLLSSGLADLIGAGNQKDSLPDDLGAKGSLTAGIAIGVAVTVFAPIGEEFLLRGIVYPGLRDSLATWMPAWGAVALAAVLDGMLFGALHLGGTKAIFVPILATFGLILCLLYQATGSLYANILLHATNNTLAIGMALNWTFLGGLALWVSAVCIITLLALAARGIEGKMPPPRPRLGAVPAD